ncbi:hypothetical protein Bhyg_02006 [Pseudolycoriella hygida]|uniref:Uncharacterized protein n=1 Tax=Pseudolycoriella hygida TaxID=35572 RepID=A0A9Q0S641_9DIPT|nr:hypothetical protein Bhyg_02006 [Pseudolycoriella hygida]
MARWKAYRDYASLSSSTVLNNSMKRITYTYNEQSKNVLREGKQLTQPKGGKILWKTLRTVKELMIN